MADALCGPSNALQSFQKHAQADRTLQQDRFRGPSHSPAQGFRSFDPRAGSLDAEFHAFENAPTNPFQLEQPAWQHNASPAFAAQSAPNWASDFQNLRISNSPVPVNQFRVEAPLVRTAPGGWQQEFMRQREHMTPVARQKQPESASQFGNQNLMPSFGPAMYGPSQIGLQGQLNMQQQATASELRFDETDFDQAFQDAFDHIQAVEVHTATHGGAEMVEPSMVDQEVAPIHEPLSVKIGSDAIQYTENKDRTADQDTRDANDLARVAGELVQNVSHETNAKFKNSQFLDLMRRIRDREIEVRNNDFESTQEAQSVSKPESEQFRQHDPNSFDFPDMNEVYHPDETIDMTIDENFQYRPAPRTQISDLHPGGPFYPEQSPPQPLFAQMSGAVDNSTKSNEPDNRYATA